MKRPFQNKRAVLLLLGLLLAQGSLAESIRTSLANLRDGPDKDSRIITALPKGATVRILETRGNYSLVRVTRTGLSGWIYAPAQGWEVEPAKNLPPPAASAPAEQIASTARESAVPIVAPDTSTRPPQAASPSPPATLAKTAGAYDLASTTPMPAGGIYLEMDPQEADILFRKDPFDKSAFPVKIRDGGNAIAGEIAVKGSFSRRYLKKSLLITLPKGQNWQGRRRFALNAMATDPTQAREWLTWDLARALGLRIPQTTYQKVYVNGRYIGLYFDIEWMDEAMFSRLGLANGEFYEPDDSSFCGDFSAANLARTETCWNKIFPAGGDKGGLVRLGQALNDTPVETFDAWLEANFDVQSVIDWLVINTLSQSGDTYNKNYFLHYAPAAGKWRVIPWDYDQSWGRVADNALPFPQSIHNGFFQYTHPPIIGAENPLKYKTLKNPRLYARFQARLKEVLTPGPTPAAGWFEPGRLQQRLADIKALVQPSLAQEAFPSQSAGTTQAHFEALAFFNEWRYHTLKALLLEPSPFDTPRWLPYTSYDPLTPVTPESLKQRRQQTLDLIANETLAAAGQKTPFMEKLLAYPLAFVTLRQGDVPVRVTVETDRESPPAMRPPGKAADQCVERTWFVSVKSEQPANLDLQFDYLQESSTRHELGGAIRDENHLALWRHDGKSWAKTEAGLNPIANYFMVGEQRLEPGAVNRFVACTD